MEPANSTDLPEKQVAITFPFCFNQHSDHRMLQSFLKIQIKSLFLLKTKGDSAPRINPCSSTYF